MRVVLIAIAAVAVGACSGSADSTTTTAEAATTTTVVPTTTSEAATTTTAAPADGPVAATITIQGFSFGGSPTVSVGEAVEVVNGGDVTHTWTSTDGVFDSGNLAAGASFAFTFEEAGEFDFFCRIHPSMTGTVTVER